MRTIGNFTALTAITACMGVQGRLLQSTQPPVCGNGRNTGTICCKDQYKDYACKTPEEWGPVEWGSLPWNRHFGSANSLFDCFDSDVDGQLSREELSLMLWYFQVPSSHNYNVRQVEYAFARLSLMSLGSDYANLNLTQSLHEMISSFIGGDRNGFRSVLGKLGAPNDDIELIWDTHAVVDEDGNAQCDTQCWYSVWDSIIHQGWGSADWRVPEDHVISYPTTEQYQELASKIFLEANNN